MLTHVHKVIHLVVGTFEQGEGDRDDRRSVSLFYNRPEAGLRGTDASGQA